MNKKIEDYLHFYLNAECECRMDFNSLLERRIIDGMLISQQRLWVEIKPLLRPLSSMTEEEQHDYAGFGHATGTAFGDIKLQARRTAYLLSRHFDLFGLIDAGLAIDKTSTK